MALDEAFLRLACGSGDDSQAAMRAASNVAVGRATEATAYCR